MGKDTVLVSGSESLGVDYNTVHLDAPVPLDKVQSETKHGEVINQMLSAELRMISCGSALMETSEMKSLGKIHKKYFIQDRD